MVGRTGADSAVLFRPSLSGVEVLHASFTSHEYPRHAHEYATVALMDRGAAAFRYQNAYFVAGAGNVFLLNADEVHTGRPTDTDGYRYRVLYLDPTVPGELLTTPGAAPGALAFHSTVLSDQAVAGTLHRLHRALVSDTHRLLAEQLLLRLSRLLAAGYADISAVPRRAAGTDHHAVGVVRDYLDAHATEKVSLRELAALIGFSPFTLVRMFTAAVGMPPHAYQTQVRVRVARRLLAAGLPPAAVATESGFYDQSHLSRVFRRYTGVSPAHVRAGAPGVDGS